MNRIDFNKVGTVVAILTGLAGLLGAWFLLPYKLEAAEKNIDVLESKTEIRFHNVEAEQRTQREILIRIDENVKLLRRESRIHP